MHCFGTEFGLFLLSVRKLMRSLKHSDKNIYLKEWTPLNILLSHEKIIYTIIATWQ